MYVYRHIYELSFCIKKHRKNKQENEVGYSLDQEHRHVEGIGRKENELLEKSLLDYYNFLDFFYHVKILYIKK